MKFLRRLRALFLRDKLHAEMAEEIRTHVELQTERNIGAGMNPDEARHAALRQFGNVASLQEQARAVRGWVWLEQFAQDFRQAVRALGRQRGFTFVAITTLALGLGVNTALFSIFNAVALRPLPFKDPEQLVDVTGRNESGMRFGSFSYLDYTDLRAAQHNLAGLGAWMEMDASMESGRVHAPAFIRSHNQSGSVARMPVQFVSDNFFAVLGGDLMMGRGFLPVEDTQPGAHPVIVLQHGFWTEQFNADRGVLGKDILLGNITFTVIGVTAPGFVGKMPAPPIGWVPASMLDAMMGKGPSLLAQRDNTRFQVVGRLRPEVSREQAQTELEVLARQLALKYPGPSRMTRIELKPAATFLALPLTARTFLALSPIWLGFALVLLIACANVANLQLARASTRQQEIGVRLALGASRGRILRHLLTESLLIAFAGGLAGLLVATWVLYAIRPPLYALIPPVARGLRDWLFLDLSPDYRVFGFTLGLAFVAAVASGLFPALQAARADVNASLKGDGSALARPSRLRHGLVIVQVAVCLTLLAASGLLVRHVLRFATVDTGLHTDGVYVTALSVMPANVQTLAGPSRQDAIAAGQTPAARREALELARTLPGIKAAAAVYRVPFSGRMRLTPVALDGLPPGDLPLTAQFNLVSAEYFKAMGLTLTRGRAFDARDAETAASVVVVSESTAQRFWPGQDPIGKRLQVSSVAFEGGWTGPRQSRQEPQGTFTSFEVIGVAPDTRSGLVWERDETMLYLPLPPLNPNWRATLMMLDGPRGPALALASRAAQARGLALGVTVYGALDEARDFQLLPFKGVAAVGAALGLLAMLLAVVGLYGVMAFAVSQRVREIGIRVALGATAGKVVGLFVRQGMRLVGIGVAIGSLGGVALGVVLAKAKIADGVEPLDPVPLACVALLLTVASLLACWLPARRAAKVDPMVALRAE